ncbi:Chymotrypsin-like protease CTRL-1 [Zancudomyces culisetae]|uniref:Chymotrypsin-like protease CTRL-1 n=1 Tax=Zancudomyces culisetae TaxID=1213189 RepID=A0A1R1PNN4_ZANCU|nr:Chymotrypsin-like protease CTRL-1 [Zancudomyces culisetae]|eukprot:OMH82551.1 Chymotrypsin-like protease CTRL-1 [Zancudomyces culisetae]
MKVQTLYMCVSSLLGYAAAQQGSARIVGGTDASIGKYPFAVYIINNASGSLCGGSLLSGDWVITAAHCAKDVKPEDLKVTVGETKFVTDKGIAVTQNIIHPDYGNAGDKNDIALFKLEKKVDYQPIKIHTDNLGDGEQVKALGWGLESSTATTPSNNLKEVTLKLISTDECRKRVSSFEGNGVGSQYCTGGTPGKDTCSGDSGGPLVKEKDGNWRLVGLTSYGAWDQRADVSDICGTEEIVAIYTRVSSFMDFITSNTGLSSSDIS